MENRERRQMRSVSSEFQTREEDGKAISLL